MRARPEIHVFPPRLWGWHGDDEMAPSRLHPFWVSHYGVAFTAYLKVWLVKGLMLATYWGSSWGDMVRICDCLAKSEGPWSLLHVDKNDGDAPALPWYMPDTPKL